MPFALSLGAPHVGNAHRDPRIVPTILEFLAFLVRTGSASTPRCLGQPLAALRHHLVSAGFPDPTLQSDLPLVRQVAAGAAKSFPSSPRRADALPAEFLAMLRLQAHAAPGQARATLAAAVITYAGCFRLGRRTVPVATSSSGPTTRISPCRCASPRRAGPTSARGCGWAPRAARCAPSASCARSTQATRSRARPTARSWHTTAGSSPRTTSSRPSRARCSRWGALTCASLARACAPHAPATSSRRASRSASSSATGGGRQSPLVAWPAHRWPTRCSFPPPRSSESAYRTQSLLPAPARYELRVRGAASFAPLRPPRQHKSHQLVARDARSPHRARARAHTEHRACCPPPRATS